MSSKSYAKQLRSRDPAQRKVAVKAAARNKDRSVLKQLAVMAGDDPDPAIRELARKAGVYIRQQHGELQPDVEASSVATDKNGKPAEVPVSDKAAAQARQLVSAAMSAQINDDRARAVKELRKAIELDPNLRQDAYFTSLCEQATGKQGQEAFQELRNEGSIDTLLKSQAETRRQREREAHLSKVQAAQWNGAIFDLGLFFIMLSLGVALLTFIAIQSAQGLVNQHDDRLRAWVNGEVDEQTGNPVEPMQIDAAFLTFSRETGQLPFVRAIINGLLVGVLATASLLLWGLLAHGLAAKLMRGTGSLPYLMHNWTAMLNLRLLVSLLVGGVGIAAIFGLGGGTAIMVVGGALGLVALFTLFALVSLAAQSYHVSVVKGLAATVISGAVVLGVNAAIVPLTGIRLV